MPAQLPFPFPPSQAAASKLFLGMWSVSQALLHRSLEAISKNTTLLQGLVPFCKGSPFARAPFARVSPLLQRAGSFWQWPIPFCKGQREGLCHLICCKGCHWASGCPGIVLGRGGVQSSKPSSCPWIHIPLHHHVWTEGWWLAPTLFQGLQDG